MDIGAGSPTLIVLDLSESPIIAHNHAYIPAKAARLPIMGLQHMRGAVCGTPVKHQEGKTKEAALLAPVWLTSLDVHLAPLAFAFS